MAKTSKTSGKTSGKTSDKTAGKTSGKTPSRATAKPAGNAADAPASAPAAKSADTDKMIFVGKGDEPAFLTLALANRHGLVTGATGTGKTVTLQVMAEGFARAGVPVFAEDIKGDL